MQFQGGEGGRSEAWRLPSGSQCLGMWGITTGIQFWGGKGARLEAWKLPCGASFLFAETAMLGIAGCMLQGRSVLLWHAVSGWRRQFC